MMWVTWLIFLLTVAISIGNSMTYSGNCPKYVWYLEIWKYYKPVLLQNTTYRSCYYLFIIEAETFSVTHKRPLFLRFKKQTL